MKRFFLFCASTAFAALALVLSAKTTAETSTVTAESVRLRLDVDRTVLPADTSEKAIVKIALDGLKLPRRELRPPVNLAIVIDKSGSMAGEKIRKAREAALEAVRRLGPDDIVSLVAYFDQVHTLVPAMRVGDGEHLEMCIRGIQAGGGTALFGGVTQGASEVRKHIEKGAYVNRVILLSDGLANVGPSSPEELGRLGTALMKEGISVTTIGLGLGFNEDLMTRLAQRSDGNTYFVEESADLPRIFAAELGDVLNVVARRVVIEIEFPEHVRPKCFVGREGTIRGQRAELTLNQLYGGQEKFALVEVEVDPRRAGAELEIARARVSYEDALTQRAATLTAKRTVQFSASRAHVVSSANHKVQADYAVNALAEAKDQAVALVDANRRDEAAAQVRMKAEELSRAAETYGNRAVRDMAAAAAPEADAIEREGLSNAKRKAYRAENLQIMNQQSSATR